MKIASKFRDYYDSAQGYGYDPKLVYVREEKVLWKYDGKINFHDSKNKMPDHLEPITRGSSYRANKWEKSRGMPSFIDSTTGTIAFCGKLYPFYKLPCGTYCYSFDQVYKTISEHPFYSNGMYDRKTLLKSLETGKNTGYSYWGRDALCKEAWDKWLSGFDSGIGDKLHVATKAPVLVLTRDTYGGTITANPRLNQYNFASQVDPFTAYQELSMYIGNNLVEQKDPNPYIPDVLRAESHGFDKWSFRKPPTKKK